MADSTSAASEALESAAVNPAPVRTCVGCRSRAAAAELVRITADRTARGDDGGSDPAESVRVSLDLAGRAPGRGAWLHPDPECLRQAQRRGSIARALRLVPPIDTAELAVEFAQRFGEVRHGNG